MITEDYVSFETAKLLKEKGFDEATYHDYDEKGKRWFQEVLVCHNSQGGIACPTLQMAMKWLRDKYNWYIEIIRGPKGYHIWIVTIPLGVVKYITEEVCGKGIKYLDTYESACETAIKYCLENLI